MEKNTDLSASIEALLFVHGESLEIKKIAQILNESESSIKTALENLNEILKDRGLTLIFSGNRVQLATKPEFAPFLENFIKNEFEENLTPAALETLSLVAYLGPISRPRIDYIRGVNSAYTIRNLMMRGLIEKVLDAKAGNSFLYQASFDLLKYLGISRSEDLPEFEKYKSLISETAAN